MEVRRPFDQAPLKPPAFGDGANDLVLYDVLAFLRTGWTWLVAAVGCGLLIGLAYAMLAPAQFQTSASLQLATVANEPVEPVTTVAEKLKLPRYFSSEVFAACGLAGSPAPGEALNSRLKTTVNKNAALINLQFESETANDSERCIVAVFAYLRDDQAKLAAPLISTHTFELNAFRERLKEAEKFRAQLLERSGQPSFAEASGATQALALSALATTTQEIRELLTEVSRLERALSPAQTHPTAFAAPLYMKDARTPMERALMVLGMMLVGLLVGIGLLIVRSAWRVVKVWPARV